MARWVIFIVCYHFTPTKSVARNTFTFLFEGGALASFFAISGLRV